MEKNPKKAQFQILATALLKDDQNKLAKGAPVSALPLPSKGDRESPQGPTYSGPPARGLQDSR